MRDKFFAQGGWASIFIGMDYSMRKKIFTIAFCMIASPAFAQQAGTQAATQISDGGQVATAILPDLTGQDSNTGMPQALSFLKQSGIGLTYLGDDGGVLGYLGVSPDGKSQTFYVWPNNTDFAIGPLYNDRGENVSSDQITLMQQRYAEAHAGRPVTPILTHSAPAMDMPPGMDPKAIPALSLLAKKGDNFIYLGGDGGSPGYLISNDSTNPPAYTTVYVTPDGKHDVIGIMIGELGQNITAKQVSNSASLDKIKAIVAGQAESQATPAAPPSATTPPPSTAASSAGGMGGGIEAPPAAPPPAAVSEKDFMSAVVGAAKFRVGYQGPPSPPVVYLVADPQCPHCHEAWDAMKPLIMAHKITVQVILVNAIPGSGKLDEEILTNPRPGLAWLDGWADHPDLIQPTQTATAADYQQAQTYLADNMAFVNTFKKVVDGKQVNAITAVPFIAYKGNDGVWRAEQGPPDVAAFLSGDE